jgi:hypothetical protein
MCKEHTSSDAPHMGVYLKSEAVEIDMMANLMD